MKNLFTGVSGMANQEHLDLLKQGRSVWNAWRVQHNEMEPDLYAADLRDAYLSGAYLNQAHLWRADLRDADLQNADLSGADLSGAYLHGADLSEATLSGANLSGAQLTRAMLIETNFAGAILTNCKIYGISAWGVELEGATQNNLCITLDNEPTITVDNLKIAQFIY